MDELAEKSLARLVNPVRQALAAVKIEIKLRCKVLVWSMGESCHVLKDRCSIWSTDAAGKWKTAILSKSKAMHYIVLKDTFRFIVYIRALFSPETNQQLNHLPSVGPAL